MLMRWGWLSCIDQRLISNKIIDNKNIKEFILHMAANLFYQHQQRIKYLGTKININININTITYGSEMTIKIK